MTHLRASIIWLLIMISETLNGTCRELFLKPLMGERPAGIAAFFTALVLIMLITCFSIRWIGAATVKSLLAVGIMWAVLTVLFEGLLIRPIVGKSWEQFFADYNLFEGNLMTLGLLYLIVTPLIAAKIRGVITS